MPAVGVSGIPLCLPTIWSMGQPTSFLDRELRWTEERLQMLEGQRVWSKQIVPQNMDNSANDESDELCASWDTDDGG